MLGCFHRCPWGAGELRAQMRKCVQALNFAQGGRLPKRDIVDTTFHASCAARHNMRKQGALPTTWGMDRAIPEAHEVDINWHAGLQRVILLVT